MTGPEHKAIKEQRVTGTGFGCFRVDRCCCLFYTCNVSFITVPCYDDIKGNGRATNEREIKKVPLNCLE